MKTQLTENKIQKALNSFFASWRYNVDGLFVFRWESDKLIWTKAGYIYEFEIKISRSDYRNDFKHKAEKHLLLNSKIPNKKSQAIQQDLFENLLKEKRKHYPSIPIEYVHGYPEDTRLPNYFFYAVPKGMLSEDEIPPYAGLVEIEENGMIGRIIQAPRLHSEKYTDGELNLGEKFYYNMKSWQRRHKEETQYALMYQNRLQNELASKNQEKSYKELQDELAKALNEVKAKQASAEINSRLYLDMCDYNDLTILERNLLLSEVKKHDPNFDYKALMEQAENIYDERYPGRQKFNNKKRSDELCSK